ncbi:MAG: DUF2779 domain-containing protein [Nitrospirae bacterium]|nr:DUF2779 domain-containing protein [Nitrospirota bacterium]
MNFGRLSKSKYLSGLQCPKRLYLEVHQPELIQEVDTQTLALLEVGTEVGQLARQYFPNGVLVEWDHSELPDAVEQTAQLVKNPKILAIFEGAFLFDGVLVRVDILERIQDHQWRLIEVKASTERKDHHVDDLAIQAYVLANAGLALAGSWLLHLNNQYVYQGGDLNLTHLFMLENLSPEVDFLYPNIPERLHEMRSMLAEASPPAIEPDGHCSVPYDCPFWDHCTKEKPDRWVFYLPRVGKKFDQLRNRGITSIDEIPTEFTLSRHQQLVKDRAEWIGPGLMPALGTIQYPVHHLDFETVQLAIPQYPLTRPYQTLPTQWSNHIESIDGEIRHEEFLCEDRIDPREEFLHTLLASLEGTGSICVFSPYEERILRDLREAFPLYASQLDQVIGRLWDLLPILREHYYHPAFGGSYSLKAVLPALVPSLDYNDLAIHDGGMAADGYIRLIFGGLDVEERTRLKADLLAYCKRDTLALLELRRVLWERRIKKNDKS